MPDEISLTIGPQGQPPSTYYVYLDGLVTLGARPATQRTPSEVRSVVSSIEDFARIVRRRILAPPATPPAAPYHLHHEVDADLPGVIAARFRCPASAGNLNVNASIDLVTRITTFEERPQKTIAWSAFEMFVRFMDLLAYTAQRL